VKGTPVAAAVMSLEAVAAQQRLQVGCCLRFEGWSVGG
jgi:hypothetical protein